MKPILSRRTLVSWSSVRPLKGAPSTLTSPAEGRSRPPTRLSSVDLPEPDGPMIATISPRGITSETASSATTSRWPANCFVTPRSSIIVDAGTPAGGAGVSDRMTVVTPRLCERLHNGVKLRLNTLNFPPSLAVAKHPLERRRILLDVEILDRHLPPRVVVPGGSRIRSGVLAEDIDH